MIRLRRCFELQDMERLIKVSQNDEGEISIRIDCPEDQRSSILVSLGYGPLYPKNLRYDVLLEKLGL